MGKSRELPIQVDKNSERYRVCPECKKEFMAAKLITVFCSIEHSNEYHNKRKAKLKAAISLEDGICKQNKSEKRYITLNSCKHYFLNEGGYDRLYFTDDPNFVEVDLDMVHPVGNVYKPKGVLGNMVRFVKQPNNTILIFNIKEWNDDKNPYAKRNCFHPIKILRNIWQSRNL